MVHDKLVEAPRQRVRHRRCTCQPGKSSGSPTKDRAAVGRLARRRAPSWGQSARPRRWSAYRDRSAESPRGPCAVHPALRPYTTSTLRKSTSPIERRAPTAEYEPSFTRGKRLFQYYFRVKTLQGVLVPTGSGRAPHPRLTRMYERYYLIPEGFGGEDRG
jgi:hypothetical protein